MSGWNPEYNKWSPNCKDLTDANNWTTAQFAAGTYDAPTINSTTTDGASLLEERVEATVAAGFKTASNNSVLSAPGDYYINNYFNTEHYNGFGHIDGAVRVLPLGISNLNNLDSDGKVVTYCYTGQTSAIITAFLNVVGFEAYSLTFGVNGMTSSNPFWEAGNVPNHWGHNANPKNLPFETNN